MTMMMIQTVRRRNDNENLDKKKKRKEKKSSVFLLFCVSVGSFCDELTVVFCSFVGVRFLLIHKLLIGVGGVGGAGVCFLFLLYLEQMLRRRGRGEKKGRPPTGRRNGRMISAME